jgi:anti-sigma B factor antagonist
VGNVKRTANERSGRRVGSTPGFQLQIVEAGGRVLARAVGELDAEAAATLESQLAPLCHPGRRVILDLRRVEYLDSNGVRVLLRLHRDLQAGDGELRLVLQADSRARRTLSLLQLEDYFRIEDSALLAWIRKPRAVVPAPSGEGRRCLE